MRKIFLAVSLMIVAGFLVKSYKKLCAGEPDTDLDELHRRMKAAHEAHLEIERRRAEARPTIAKLDSISTPRDGGLMSAIGSVQQMAPGRFA